MQNINAVGLKLWSTPVTPASYMPNSVSASVTVGGPPQVANASSGSYVDATTSLPASNNLSGLNFDANAATTIWLKHRDTGQFSLNATLDSSATSSTPALSLSGTTTVKAIPLGYGVAAATVQASAGIQAACAVSPSAACDNAAGAGLRVASAGNNFASTVTAALWTIDGDTDLSDNPVAPNYSGAVTLNSALTAPTAGSSGTLGVTNITLNTGNSTSASQNWTQSGAMRIAASGNYLGQPITGQSMVLGRFSPKNFNTLLTTQGCNTFTYSRQPITKVTVNAMDAAAISAITPNYVGAFTRLVTLSDANGSTAGNFTANTIAVGLFSAGSAISAPVFSFTNPKTAPLTVILRASDGETSSVGFTEASAEIRSGRIRLSNAYGSELLALQIPIKVEFWNSNVGWSTNSADTCSAVSKTNFSFSFPAGTSAKPNNLAACETAITVTGTAPNFSLSLSKPGIGNNGWSNLSLNLGNSSIASNSQCVAVGVAGANDIPANQSWLQFYWKGSGLSNPEARAFFGIFGVKSPIIYQRENY
ncbi:MAG: hypothetical protein NTY70_06865 [Burkholderiales bacterium]|nr:hypothetical protein [Burkholderiales bacterium]